MRVLILTVGTTRAPLEEALAHHAPEGVVFLASQDSHPVAAELVRDYGGSFRHHTLLVEDTESLLKAYQVALKALAKALEWEATAIVADLTGGTKPMAAGLVLALTGRGVVFSYVGGERRDRETGRVLPGAERVRLLEDPTARLGLREWAGFTRAWNALNLGMALTELEALLQRPLSPSETRFYSALREVVLGLMEWDRFRHAQAWGHLSPSLPVALAVAEAWGHGAKVRVLKGLESLLPHLRAIVEAEGRPTFPLLQDLLANAERRAALGRYDDALARLYRALELAVEADVHERLGFLLKDPRTWPQGFPPSLRDRILRPRGLMELLEAGFELDLAFGQQGTLTQRLFGEKNRLQALLNRRHESILAHGTKPVGEEDYRRLLEFLSSLDPRLTPLPPWPRF
ncbi:MULTISPECIES: TIGR02710 family CRISPR-associated CARF protein [Thermus]|jgi:CRISPR-associated protein (TIGR02710 family)|uniref:CRISPR-associated protein (Cas_Cas02710) n=1 Tax=Thermus brockianus TaxID=56956 RepID=A0A1J0LWA7_THEBO|nr:TIGR02710 family CRISPR-associated CARF protein [Thermus brockianus]APD10324.1 CRISPR-associated protein (Cas_Cas02710) [Thermus brockianus]